jgi:Polysaccharide pyruvyl transferase
MVRRIFVIYHSGEVYDRDSVRWYTAQRPAERERLLRLYHNIGDSIVYDSTLKLLDYDYIKPIDPNNLSDEDIDWLNSEFSYGVIRGSNYLHAGMDWGSLAELLRRLRVPVVVPGVGTQSPHDTRPQMTASTIEIIQLLADRCQSLGVRGDISAECLWRLGIKNVRIVGCPSMFRQGRPDWQVDNGRLERLKTAPLGDLRLAFTLRREIGPDYVADVAEYIRAQKTLLTIANDKINLMLFAQGELFEKFFFLNRADLYEHLFGELIDSGWARDRSDSIFNIYREKLFFSTDVPAFVEELRKADIATGFRVHGVLPSLALGIPGVLVDYDSRTRELIETFGIPSVRVGDADLERILEVARQHDYGRVSRRYAHTWDEMRSFLEENGAAHRMSTGDRFARFVPGQRSAGASSPLGSPDGSRELRVDGPGTNPAASHV